MKKALLTLENVERALAFIKRRITHAKTTKNKEWQKEFENVANVIQELSTHGK